MSSRPRSSKPTTATPEPAPRSPWVAVSLGLLMGQLGYLYTRQTRRFVISMLVGTLAIGLACAAAVHQNPGLFDMNKALDDLVGWVSKVESACGIVTLVATLNNVACAVDLYLQTRG